jgi:DNA-binding SARP family transcriptional activator
MKLYISTLGEFDIKVDGQSILRDSARMYKIYRLFEYFLTFRNKKLLPETIIDNLLSDSESDDPKNLLRTQIFRLRKTLNLIIPKNEDPQKYLSINFINGYYCLETGENVVIDIEEFEDYIKQGDLMESYEDSINHYKKAIDLYKGIYLSNNAYEVWLVPTRNYYHRLYLKTLYKHIGLLKKNGEYERIVSLCERTLLIEQYEENIHIELMEALLKSGQSKLAINHYEYAINMLEREMYVKPSQRFIDFIKKIQSHSSYKSDLDISDIKRNLDEDAAGGAMLCSLDYFKFIFKIQKRKSLRNNQNDYLCILTINRDEHNEYNNSLNDVLLVLKKSLRKSDVFASWNDNQVLIMLHDVKGSGIDVIKQRLINDIVEYAKINRNVINVTYQPLQTQKTI